MTVAIPMLLASWLVSGPVAATTQTSEDRVYKQGDGVTLPVVVEEVKPRYPDEAKKARIEGDVTLLCVVRQDGTVGDVEVKKSAEASLDKAAVDAVKQWKFKPGTKDGKSVAVQVEIEITFRLK
jgi:protein TonB